MSLTHHSALGSILLQNPSFRSSEVRELEDPCVILRQVLLGIPGGRPEALQPPVPDKIHNKNVKNDILANEFSFSTKALLKDTVKNHLFFYRFDVCF